MTQLRALTVVQPWAWAIVSGGKDVENRRQPWTYRGPLAIHAGLRWSESGAVADAIIEAAVAASPADAEMVRWFGVDPRHEDYTRGAVVGVVDLVDVHWARAGCCDSAWAEPGPDVVHLVLEQPRALERPVPCRGALGLWFLPDDVRAEVDAQL